MEHIRTMQKWGNKRANEYWEYNLPKDYRRPTENSTMADLEKFIRAKYEKKLWVRDDLRSDSEYSDYSYSDAETPSKPNASTLLLSQSLLHHYLLDQIDLLEV